MDAAREQHLVTWTQVIYALHALSLVTGIIGVATVVGAFLTGWPSIIAVILNYLKRSDVRGTWLESHFRWQIRTFWYGLLWVSLCVLFVVATLGIGILVSLVYAFAAMAQLVVGHILDRGALKSVLVAVIGFQLPLLLAAAFFNNYVLLAVALAMMFFVFGQIPINDAMVAAYTDEAWRARVFGVRYVFSFGASAFAVPLVALMYRYSSDFRYLFFTLAAMAAVMLAAAVLLPSRARREIGDRPRFPTPSAGKRGLSP